jgi:hypothetical protein
MFHQKNIWMNLKIKIYFQIEVYLISSDTV